MDDYSRHEALHMLNVMSEMLSTHLLEHEYVRMDWDIQSQVLKADDALSKAYQILGEKHL